MSSRKAMKRRLNYNDSSELQNFTNIPSGNDYSAEVKFSEDHIPLTQQPVTTNTSSHNGYFVPPNAEGIFRHQQTPSPSRDYRSPEYVNYNQYRTGEVQDYSGVYMEPGFQPGNRGQSQQVVKEEPAIHSMPASQSIQPLQQRTTNISAPVSGNTTIPVSQSPASHDPSNSTPTPPAHDRQATLPEGIMPAGMYDDDNESTAMTETYRDFNVVPVMKVRNPEAIVGYQAASENARAPQSAVRGYNDERGQHINDISGESDYQQAPNYATVRPFNNSYQTPQPQATATEITPSRAANFNDSSASRQPLNSNTYDHLPVRYDQPQEPEYLNYNDDITAAPVHRRSPKKEYQPLPQQQSRPVYETQNDYNLPQPTWQANSNQHRPSASSRGSSGDGANNGNGRYNQIREHYMGTNEDYDLPPQALAEVPNSPVFSDSSHFTSISQRPPNPNYYPAQQQQQRDKSIAASHKNDFVLAANPDFQVSGPAKRTQRGPRKMNPSSLNDGLGRRDGPYGAI